MQSSKLVTRLECGEIFIDTFVVYCLRKVHP